MDIHAVSNPLGWQIKGTVLITSSRKEHESLCKKLLEIINKMFMDDARVLTRVPMEIKSGAFLETELSEP